mmetsp:Transcript_23398/g.58517  ORF Transcript_23398/g.58517 Transcript_23398/m.58517 type:complete len:306 (+) Transcript_23398:78-995(+)|eukprot:CAMPEP_0177638924 /NCGR_PEP_ID=MMETSP0447-20121125/5749_1 /TAXON_ID=0 /ORGANISM="Stygamoeba regulata, Strain BSH-02190019" /LENGTH=305 /DNA_ID=CAMNT_0019140921 /DNA_START=19 /DNA_END=936 /DNA_ORIENTATION=+
MDKPGAPPEAGVEDSEGPQRKKAKTENGQGSKQKTEVTEGIQNEKGESAESGANATGKDEKVEGDGSTEGNSAAASKEPFENMKIWDSSFLDSIPRSACLKCGQKRKFFCYDCFLPFGDLKKVPNLTLPMEVHIVHFPTELKSKSTAVHAKILAPNSVSFHKYPSVPKFNAEDTVLLYPKNAQSLHDMDASVFTKLKNVIFIDSQWHKGNKVLSHENLVNLPRVQIHQYKTAFWRYQQEGDHCLATIEAIYYFFVEYQKRAGADYDGRFDNLLFYYSHMFRLIQGVYKRDPSREFNRKKNYIQYD